VSKWKNCKERGGWARGATDGPFDKYNNKKFMLDYAINYSTDIMRKFFIYK